MFSRIRAANLNKEGIARREAGDLDGAMEKYRLAAAADPTWSVPHYNMGLVCKNRHQWPESLEHCQRAAELDPTDQASLWNLGIAATALGRWNVARSAWRSFGIKVPVGNGPLDLPCGFCPIRINPNGDAEVVWAHRLDPARAMLRSIPFPESKHRWGDIVLNDGAPTGFRKYGGKEVPVFDAIEILQPSPYGTYTASVQISSDVDCAKKLAQLAAQMDGCAEDWTTSVRLLCKACSEGRPHSVHDSDAIRKAGAHSIAIAARDRSQAEKILHEWETSTAGVVVEYLEDPLNTN